MERSTVDINRYRDRLHRLGSVQMGQGGDMNMGRGSMAGHTAWGVKSSRTGKAEAEPRLNPSPSC